MCKSVPFAKISSPHQEGGLITNLIDVRKMVNSSFPLLSWIPKNGFESSHYQQVECIAKDDIVTALQTQHHSYALKPPSCVLSAHLGISPPSQQTLTSSPCNCWSLVPYSVKCEEIISRLKLQRANII